MVAGEIHFAPTNIAYTFEDESYADGGSRFLW
jgi:hypothetical protein